MASLKRWVLVAGLGCLTLALAYLPPRGANSSGRRSIFVSQSPQRTPARQRAQSLAEEWRAADGALQLVSTRRRLQEGVRQSAGRGQEGSLVVLIDSVGASDRGTRLVDSALHAAWSQLGLGETKVRVAVLIQLAPATTGRDRPLRETGLGTFLAPDSTDRTTCIAVLPMARYWTRIINGELPGRARIGPLVQWLKGGLGPCAFYAAYGTPGRPVRQWLMARGWDLALTIDPGARRTPRNSLLGMADPRYAWYWDAVYSLPPSAVGCLAGRPEACRAAVLAGASEHATMLFPDIVRVDRRWGRRQRLPEAQRFLGDVAHEVGRDRFLTFWTSAQPVDTALAAALKRPVGEWTAAWQREFVKPIRLGPTPPLGSAAVALTIAALALALVMATASRREVR